MEGQRGVPQGSRQGLEQVQEQPSSLDGEARRLVDNGHAGQALALVRRGNPTSANIITAICIGRADETKRRQAWALFEQFVSRCEQFSVLMQVLKWLRNPKRRFIPSQYQDTTQRRMSVLNPEWDGSLMTTDEAKPGYWAKLKSMRMDQIDDPKICLRLMGEARPKRKAAYISRYLELGGSEDNMTYLRVRLNCVLLGLEGTTHARRLIERLAAAMEPGAFRRWVRNNTRADFNMRDAAKNIPRSFALRVLAHYVRVLPEGLGEDDWTYVTQRAIDLGDPGLQRVCRERLAGGERSQTGRSYPSLLRTEPTKNKPPLAASRETEVLPERVSRQFVNPIYGQIATRAPVDKAAALAIARWADETFSRRD